MGGVLHVHCGTVDWDGKTDRSLLSQDWGDLASLFCKVHPCGVSPGSQGGLWDGSNMQGTQSADRGWETCYADAMEESLAGRRMGISPH